MQTSSTPEPQDVIYEPMQWTLPIYKLGEFMDRVEKANRRLEKAGINDHFVVSYGEPFERVQTLPTGHQVTSRYVEATMTTPFQVTIGKFTFVASLIAEEAGYVTHCAPGQNLTGWVRPLGGDKHCDH